PAIDAMTITERKRRALQFVSRPTAEASSCQLHIINSSLAVAASAAMNNLVTLRPIRPPLYLSGVRASGGLSVRNSLIWKLGENLASEERDRVAETISTIPSAPNLQQSFRRQYDELLLSGHSHSVQSDRFPSTHPYASRAWCNGSRLGRPRQSSVPKETQGPGIP